MRPSRRSSEGVGFGRGSICVLDAYCSRHEAPALRSTRFRALRASMSVAGLAVLVAVGGCTSSSSQSSTIFGGLFGPPIETPTPNGPTPTAAAAAAPKRAVEPERSGCGSAAQCRVALKSMIDSPDRGWIGQQQPPFAYADGTRLFAYRALRKQLTCNELGLAVAELGAASKSMGGSVAGMTPDQLSRTRTLSSQVEGELTRERLGRCRI